MMATKPEAPRHPLVDVRTGIISAPWQRYFQDLKLYFDDLVNVVTSVFGRTGTVIPVAGDYAASKITNDSSVAGATAKDALDALKAASDGLAAKRSWTLKTALYTAAAFERVLCDTSGGAFTVKMPASPATGDEVFLFDAKGTWNTGNLTADGNGKNIMGAGTRVYSTANGWAALVYNGTDWRERV